MVITDALSNLLTKVSLVVTQAISWVGTVSDVITSDPLILLFVIVPFVGLGVGLIKRMIRI